MLHIQYGSALSAVCSGGRSESSEIESLSVLVANTRCVIPDYVHMYNVVKSNQLHGSTQRIHQVRQPSRAAFGALPGAHKVQFFPSVVITEGTRMQPEARPIKCPCCYLLIF